MAITSIITTDNGAQTSALTILLDGAIEIDRITFNDSTQQLTFPVTSKNVSLSVTDICAFLKLIPMFSASLKASFADLNQPQYQSFSSMNSTLYNAVIVSKLGFEIGRQGKVIYEIASYYPNGTTEIKKRDNASVLSYAEWLYLVYEMANFNLFVLNAYNQ